MVKNLAYLLALHSVDGLGPVRLKKVLEYFKDPKSAWEASLGEFKTLGIPAAVLENLKQKRSSLDPEKNLEYIQSKGIKVLTTFDDNYPKLLSQIYDLPVVLYYKGEILKTDSRAIAVVGSRKMTAYGRLVTEKLCKELVDMGFTIVSGLAFGVDTTTHQTVVSEGGRTLAVLGGGINNVFPAQNKALAQKIAEGQGAYLSEYPPDYPHLAGNFPSRNRIIAGLSLGVLVTEAAEKSGSLITARLALEDGRAVFALPGPITQEQSLGTARLIKEGARITTSVEDILEELGMDRIRTDKSGRPDGIENLGETERKILSLLDNSKHIDEVCRELKLQSAAVSSALVRMEILGVVKNLGQGIYSKNF